MKAEIDRLNGIIKDRDDEIARRKLEFDNLYNDLEGWKRKYADLENDFARMKSDYDSQIGDLKSRLAGFERDIADWQRRFNDLQSELGNSSNQSQGL
jgi:predicted  nucleic acid-binding Zn-ribbon protein